MTVEHLFHDEPCCGDTDRPHTHVGEEDGVAFITLGRHEWRGGEIDEVVDALEAYLTQDKEQT